jgi:hypothetical protein
MTFIYTYNIIYRFPTKKQKPSKGYTRNTRNTHNLANHTIPTKRKGLPTQHLQSLSITEYLPISQTLAILSNQNTLEGISRTLPDGPVKFVSSFFESQSMLEQTPFHVGTSLPVSGSTCNENDDIPDEEDTDG